MKTAMQARETQTETNSGRGSFSFVLFATAVTALGGFLFGYDTAVINGANTYLQRHFALDPARDAGLIGLATASAIIGCIPGALCAGFISDRFGRRRVLFFCALLYALSGGLSAIPQTFSQFIAARILSGIAIGVSSMICPVYIAEIAPPDWRGRLGSLFQLGIVIGIFITLFINGWVQRPADPAWNTACGWRWMLGTEAVPALVFLLLLLGVPESPRWLIQAGREPLARTILERIGGSRYAETEIAAVTQALQKERGSFSDLFSSSNKIPLFLAIALMAGSQLSGINAIMYYSTEIFRTATGNAQVAFQASIWIGLVNLVATFVAILFVDKVGRKPLLLVGNVVQVVALSGVAWIYSRNSSSPALLWLVIIYVAAFAMAMGPLPWIVCSEVFPAKLRGRAMSVATFCIWASCLAVAQTFPFALQRLGPGKTFLSYAVFSGLTFCIILRYLPETKGRTLEEIELAWRIRSTTNVNVNGDSRTEILRVDEDIRRH